ncbi:MAG TPA: hypothetical protein VE465_13240 [Streptosporangiaceae bacterium]|nr:hypothetical protein [Streptosporangiaceae bacterium]
MRPSCGAPIPPIPLVLGAAPLALALALAGCGSGGVLSGPAETPRPIVTQTVAPPPGGVRSPLPKPSGRPAAFKGVEMLLPAGWRLGPVVRDSTCALPADQVSCLGGPLTIKTVGAGGWPGTMLDRASGWQGSAPPICYAAGAVPPDHADQGRARLTVRSTVRAADGTALAYREWEVPCTSGRSFTVKLWYAAAKRVVFYTLSASPEYANVYRQIVAGADFTRAGA